MSMENAIRGLENLKIGQNYRIITDDEEVSVIVKLMWIRYHNWDYGG